MSALDPLAFDSGGFDTGVVVSTVAPVVTPARGALRGLYDQYLDPITLDYVDTDDGEWLETADSRTLVMIMIDTRLGKSYSAPTDGTRIAELLERGEPVTPGLVVAELLRVLGILEKAGVVTAVSVEDSEGSPPRLLVDEAGRFSPVLHWIDLATGSPVDVVYTQEA